MNKSRSGFTIVELLIVIVVIGILAAITIVAYRGMQQRATTAAITSAVDQWEKLIRMQAAVDKSVFEVEHGESSYVCLSSDDVFPSQDGFPTGECISFLAANGNRIGMSATYRSALFDAWPATLPEGTVPETKVMFTSGASTFGYRARGIAANFLNDSFIQMTWVPQVAGQCGRGVVSVIGNDGPLSGGMCTLNIDI